MEIFPRWHRYTRAQLGLPQLDVIPCRERSHLPPEKENHRFLKGDNMAGCLEGFFHGFENMDLLMRVVSHFYAFSIGIMKATQDRCCSFVRNARGAHWTTCKYTCLTHRSGPFKTKAMTSKNYWKTLNHRKKGELWQTREPHKNPGTLQQRKIRQNFTLTSADSFGSTKNQVPKLYSEDGFGQLILHLFFSRIHQEKNQRHFYEMIS